MSNNAFLEYAFDESVDKNFNILSTMNPNGKWDWYSIEKERRGSSPIPSSKPLLHVVQFEPLKTVE